MWVCPALRSAPGPPPHSPRVPSPLPNRAFPEPFSFSHQATLQHRIVGHTSCLQSSGSGLLDAKALQLSQGIVRVRGLSTAAIIKLSMALIASVVSK